MLDEIPEELKHLLAKRADFLFKGTMEDLLLQPLNQFNLNQRIVCVIYRDGGGYKQ